jgi:hypothetical protein
MRSDNEEESALADSTTSATPSARRSRGKLLKYVTIVIVLAFAGLFGDSIYLRTAEKQIAESQFKVVRVSDQEENITLHPGGSITALLPPAPNGLWIHVKLWNEGMGHWTYSFSQLLALAKKLNATLVEPGILNGRLVVEGNLWFSDVFDRSLLEDYHAKFATLQQFQEVASDETPVFDLCLKKKLCRNPEECSGPRPSCHNGIPTSFGERSSEILERAIASSQNRRTVLNIHQYWAESFNNMYLRKKNGTRNTKLVQETQVDRITDHHLPFVDKLHDMADASLERMGIAGDYAVIHWRAEKKELNYMECAHGVARTKDAMDLPPNTTFVLISSLMQDSAMEWGGAARQANNTSAPQALDFLINDHSFLKVGSVVNTTEVKDLVIYSVLDLIVSLKATDFSTCAKSCRKPNLYCQQCNHQGHFAMLAMDMRGASNKKSLACWPQSVGEKFTYYNYEA